jgi:TolB-like protein/Flp pilus assembly protein TadD
LSFLNELKRRNVLRVGAAYIVSSWLLIQVAETIFPLFGYGDTPARLVVIVLAIAFIPSLIFAWVFEITPEGLKRDADVDREQSISQSTGKKLDRIILFVLALALGYFAFDKFVLDPARDAKLVEETAQKARSDALVESYGDKSIAVLPFDNISPDPGDAYFANGMHEEITTQLGRIQSLAVTSRNSAMHYIPGTAPTRQIATELGVDFILEGSVRKDTSRTRIAVQLIDARIDEQLWAEVYDRDFSTASLFDIQADIARRVASSLRVRVSSVERGRISGRSTENRVAYDLYLRASQLWYGSDRSANTAAVELLKQALAIDPGFAQARATLADAYVKKALFLGYPRREWADAAIALARQAIDDDPSLPMGYYALAAGHSTLGQLPDAVKGFEKVLKLQPSNGTALAWLSFMQYQRGRLDEAVDLVRRAFRVDPRNQILPFNMMEFETSLGNYRNVERWLQVAEARDPNHPYLSSHRVLIFLAEGKTSEAVEEAERNLSAEPQDLVEALSMAAEAWLRAGNFEQARQYLEEVYRIAPKGWGPIGRPRRMLLGWALLKLGDTERGLALLEEVAQEAHHLIEQGNEEPVLRREVAAVYAATGDRQRAYEWLERAIDSGWLQERVYVSPLFESIRGEERFQQLMDRIDADLERMNTRIEREGLAPPFP